MPLPELDKKKTIKVLRFLFILTLPVFILVVVLLTQGDVRTFLFRGLTKIPTIITHQIIRFKTRTREFSSANIWLNRQLNIVEDFSAGHNTLLQGLIDNAEFVMARTRFPEDLESLQPFMQRFAETYPKLFLPRLWYAKSLSAKNYEEAYHQLILDLVALQVMSFDLAVGSNIEKVFIAGGFAKNGRETSWKHFNLICPTPDFLEMIPSKFP